MHFLASFQAIHTFIQFIHSHHKKPLLLVLNLMILNCFFSQAHDSVKLCMTLNLMNLIEMLKDELFVLLGLLMEGTQLVMRTIIQFALCCA